MSNTIRLKNGETMVCRVIDDPKDEEAPGLRNLLVHKDDIWQYHLDAWMSGDIESLETSFCVGSIDDELVGNIMTQMHRGIGLMGHVFTKPNHRRKGICDALMEMHKADFVERGGSAVFLGTGYESAPYHIYYRHGYRDVPKRPGSMWWSPCGSRDIEKLYEDLYGDLAGLNIEEVNWRQWPSMNVFTHLPMARMPQLVRSAAHELFGVCQSESGFLSVIKTNSDDKDAKMLVVETREGHVAGLATLASEKRWGPFAATYVFDICLHPNQHDIAEDLLEGIEWPNQHVLAYAAETDKGHIGLLSQAGFQKHSQIERFFEGGIGLVIMDRQ